MDIDEAVKAGDEPLPLRQLDADPALVSKKIQTGSTALHYAALERHSTIAEGLLKFN